MGALFAGVGAAWLFEKTGSWTKVFWAMIACDLIAAFLALFWLKPVAARTVEASERAVAPAVDMTAPAKA
jgi:sugar phosphate permease